MQCIPPAPSHCLSDFGITPYSALLGLLAVQDAVTIRFELVAHAQR